MEDKDYELALDAMVEKARTNLKAFLYLTNPQDSFSTYKLAKLHLALGKIFEDTVKTEGRKNEAVSCPPQHGKSQTLSVRCVAWYVGWAMREGKGQYVGLTGFSYSLLVDFLKDIKKILSSPMYQLIFPECDMRKVEKDTQTHLVLANGASIMVKPAGSKFTGRPLDLLIIDDPHAGRKEAESIVARESVKQWFDADLSSRVTATAKILIIATRWHPEDLIGKLISDEHIEELEDAEQGHLAFGVTNIPAICTSESDYLGRAIGEPLFPEKRPLSFLLGQKASIPSYEWDSQWDGNPRSSGSDQVDISKINYCKLDEVPREAEFRRGWDFAVTEKTSSDFSAGAGIYYLPATREEKAMNKKEKLPPPLPTVYLVDIEHKKLAWAKLKSIVVAVALQDLEKYNATKLAMEAISGFKIGRDELRTGELKGRVKIDERNPPAGGKLLRAQAWLNLIEAGKFYIIRDDDKDKQSRKWIKKFKDELRTFPDGDHDDQVDGVSVAFESCHKSGKKIMVV